MRTPDEILSVFDEAQRALNINTREDFNLRDLLWEVLTDVLSTIQLAEDESDSVYDIVSDYLAHYYGDD